MENTMNKTKIVVFLYILNFNFTWSQNVYYSSLSKYKSLKPKINSNVITIKEAIEKSFEQNPDLNIAKNHLEQRKSQRLSQISSMLPKIRANSRYLRNFPETKANFVGNNESQAQLYERIADVLKKNQDQKGADELLKSADELRRRSSDQSIIITPKDAFETKITLEIPIFNGPDIISISSSFDAVYLEEMRLKEEQAFNIFNVTKSYFQAFYNKNIYLLKESQAKTLEERFLKASDQFKNGLINQSDLLNIESIFLMKMAENKQASLDFQNSLAELGLKIGMSEEFLLQNPEDLQFEILKSDEDTLIELGLSHRSDIKSQKTALSMAKKGELSGVMQFLPTITLQGDANYNSNIKGFMKDHWTYVASINFGLSFDIARFGKIRENSFKKAEEEIKLQQLLMEMKATIRGKKAKIDQLATELLGREAYFKSTEEASKFAQDQYNNGLIDYELWRRANDQNLEAQILLAKTKSEIMQERLALAHEIGFLTPKLISQ